jgi:hypothetical protein
MAKESLRLQPILESCRKVEPQLGTLDLTFRTLAYLHTAIYARVT